MKHHIIKWNDKVRMIISDVDETVADLYVRAEPAMIKELERLLTEDRVLFLITGQSVKSVQWRITDYISKNLRKRILIGHCSGVEVWGFDEVGELRMPPYYSLYETTISELQKKEWRKVVRELIEEFKLKVFQTMSISEFRKKTNGDPLSIMFEDRGPQITFEVVNGYDLSPEQVQKLEDKMPFIHKQLDLRIPILKRAEQLLEEKNLPITPRLAGVFAIDFAIKGVSKTTAVKYVIEHGSIMSSLGFHATDIANPENIEIWGDKFSMTQGGTDRHISEALPKQVRSITFREEESKEFPKGYNIVLWDGRRHLHEGLLEYLKSRS